MRPSKNEAERDRVELHEQVSGEEQWSVRGVSGGDDSSEADGCTVGRLAAILTIP